VPLIAIPPWKRCEAPATASTLARALKRERVGPTPLDPSQDP
jgi:hypothetical protein